MCVVNMDEVQRIVPNSDVSIDIQCKLVVDSTYGSVYLNNLYK